MMPKHALRLTAASLVALLGCSARAGCSSPSKSGMGTSSTAVRALTPARVLTLREAALIEHKGLSEFSPETNATAVDPLDKQLAEEVQPVLELMGNAQQIENNKKALSALDQVIKKHPEWPDAQFLRASLSVLVGSKDYGSILSDIDNAFRLRRASPHKGIYNSSDMYALRAKVSLLAGNPLQSMEDLETVLTSEPSKSHDVFNTGDVKPATSSNAMALNKEDLDSLVTQFPGDYRAHMFRGLFYLTFATYSEEYYGPALENLKRASRLNPRSALVKYFLGSTVEQMGFWTKAAGSDISDMTGARGGYKQKTTESALGYFREAVNLDPQFAEAHAHVATSLYSLKSYREAILSYDKVIELEPGNPDAYNDRGLAKTFAGDHYGAISDFSKAIELQSATKSDARGNSFENRAAAYVKVGSYDSGIDDYSAAIGLSFASRVFLMSLQQIRAMYPEFADITDHDLFEGLRQKYFPNMSVSDFSKHYTENQKPFEEFVIAGLYVSRGDAYLRAGSFRKAAGEYARANRIYSHATEFDRWKAASSTSDTEFTIDTQTLDFSQGNVVSLWLKSATTKSTSYREENYQIDCSGRRLKTVASMNYDAKGNVVGSVPETDWQRIVPETIGEMLHSGACR